MSAAAAGVRGAAAAAAAPETARSAARGVGVGGRASGRRGAEDRAAGGGSECGRRVGSARGQRSRGVPPLPPAPRLPGTLGARAAGPASCAVGPGLAGRSVPVPGRGAAAVRPASRATGPGSRRPAAPSGASRLAPPGPAAGGVLGGAGLSSSPLAGASLLGARGIPGQEKPVGKGTAPWPHRSPRPGHRCSSLPSAGQAPRTRGLNHHFTRSQNPGSRSVSPGRLLLSPPASAFFSGLLFDEGCPWKYSAHSPIFPRVVSKL